MIDQGLEDLRRIMHIPMDDPAVMQVIADLDGRITDAQRAALRRSLLARGLCRQWNHDVSVFPLDTDVTRTLPPEGVTWRQWIAALSGRGALVTPAFRLLADAGVIGTNWSEDARRRVWQEYLWG